MAEIDCRHFNGYKPCGLSSNCNPECLHKKTVRTQVLVIHLEALGAVLRATSILPAIHRKYPDCHVTWVTQRPADQLLANNPLIHRVYSTDFSDFLQLSAVQYDVVFCIDKSLKAAGYLNHIQYSQAYGFKANAAGKIVPATTHAQELWELGLSDEKKFFVNKKAETQLMIEALNLGEFHRDPYQFAMTDYERAVTDDRHELWSRGKKMVVGINTGCAATIPYKKLSIQNHRQLINALKTVPDISIVLLGGKEDATDHRQIALGYNCILSPTDKGLRDGMCSVAAVDIVVTGDSLGMHMAIAAKKWTVAWFGPTCAQEIDLYNRGEKILTQARCSPCWKRTCHKSPMCYDLVDIGAVVAAIQKGIRWQTSTSKQPSSEISSSQFQPLDI